MSRCIGEAGKNPEIRLISGGNSPKKGDDLLCGRGAPAAVRSGLCVEGPPERPQDRMEGLALTGRPWYDGDIKWSGIPAGCELAGIISAWEVKAVPRMDVIQMPFARLYPLLVKKVEKKGRTRTEVDQVTAWLTGYTCSEIARLEQSDISYGDFFRSAPALNPDRVHITGKVCGVRVEDIEDPLMREIRYLDKLVDELAKGKSMEAILRK